MRHEEPAPADEYFDVVDQQGRPTGQIKRRADVHRDGDWHRAFHCWVVLNGADGPAILFQRRSCSKDTWPDRLDVAVGGHYRAGEGFDDVVREINEELGFTPSIDTLISVGRRWTDVQTESWHDREIQDVYVHVLTLPVERLRPSLEEVTALDVIDLRALEALYAGDVDEISSYRHLVRSDNTLQPAAVATVTRDDFIPVDDGYWMAGSQAAAAVLKGESPHPLTLSPSPSASLRTGLGEGN